jgi:uncharacterized protein involved in exopolysaccharide biosynthesis
MGVVSQPPGLPLWSDYTRFVRRHAVSIGALMAVGLLAGFGWSLRQPTTYSATASIELSQVPKYVTLSTSDLAAPEVSIDTDAQLLRSPEVLGAIAGALGTDNQEAGRHLLVTAAPLSHVLHVTIEASSAERAAAAANAAAVALVAVRRSVLGSLQQDQLLQLRLLVATQERLLAREQASRVVIPATDELVAQIQELRTGLDELEEARRDPAHFVRAATPPEAADYANTEVPVVSGAMLGLLGGCLLGAARERFRLSVREPTFVRPISALSGGRVPFTTTRYEDNHAV